MPRYNNLADMRGKKKKDRERERKRERERERGGKTKRGDRK